jgi:hypothetical protein
MTKSTLLGAICLVALGFGAAAWLFYRFAPTEDVVASGAEELVRHIDWGVLNGDFGSTTVSWR